MTTSETYRTRLSPLSIILQIIALGVLFAAWQAGHRFVAIPCIAAILFFLFALPRIIREKERRFQLKAMTMLTTGRAAEVVSLARGQVLLQLFGASAPVDGRLGLALCELNRYGEAIPCLENAISRAPTSEATALMAALTRAFFVIGEPSRAEAEGRILLDKAGVRIGEVAVIVARARIGLGRRDPSTGEYLRLAASLSLNPDTELMRQLAGIEWDLLNGRKPGDVPADADSPRLFVRIWVQYVRGLIRESRGNAEDALKNYARAAALADGSRIWFADLARERVATLGKDHVKAAEASIRSEESTARKNADDELLRRKRKRR